MTTLKFIKAKQIINRKSPIITVDIFKAREQLDKLIDDVNTNNIPLTIINDKGKNAVLISEEKWNEINETLSILCIDKN